MSVESLPQKNQWFYNPYLDLIIGCGAWSLPLLLFVYPFGNTTGLSLSFYGLSLLINFPHYMATIYRAYRTREDFSKYRIFTLHITALLILTAIVAHWSHLMIRVLFTIYLTWSAWHYSGQNFGLALMFARRNGAKPTKLERNFFYLAFVASFIMVFFRYHTGTSNDPYTLSLGLPFWIVGKVWYLLFGIFLVLGSWGLYGMIRQTSLRAMAPTVTLFTTQFLWFVLPDILEFSGYGQKAQVSYNGGVLALMHCAQYLWITNYYARREAQASGESKWRPLAYFALLIIGGIALFVPVPWLVSYGFRYDFNASFLIFSSLINIHHFILDGAIWKLRDGRIAALLLDLREKALTTAGAGLLLGNLAGWIRGASFPARSLRFAALVLLLVMAGMDQMNNYLGIDGENLPNLLRAESLNPYDSTLQRRIALAQKKTGNIDGTIAALQQSVALNPNRVEMQVALAQLLIQNRRQQEAYKIYNQIGKPEGDSELLFNHGLLASQLGLSDEAMDSWQRSISLDPQNRKSRIYLADLLKRIGDSQAQSGNQAEAAQYYERARALQSD